MYGKHLGMALASIGESIGKSYREQEERAFREALEARRLQADKDKAATERQQKLDDEVRHREQKKEDEVQSQERKLAQFMSESDRTAFAARARGRTDFNQSTGVMMDDDGNPMPAAPVGEVSKEGKGMIARVMAGKSAVLTPEEQAAEDRAKAKADREEKEAPAELDVKRATAENLRASAQRYRQLADLAGADTALSRDPQLKSLFKRGDDLNKEIADLTAKEVALPKLGESGYISGRDGPAQMRAAAELAKEKRLQKLNADLDRINEQAKVRQDAVLAGANKAGKQPAAKQPGGSPPARIKYDANGNRIS